MAKKLQIIGLNGKSAYQYALDGGYTGSEAEFKEKMARELEVAYDYDDLNEKILATAIKQEASGTVISVSDAAAIPLLDLNYEGENVTFTVVGKNVYSGGDVSGKTNVTITDFKPIPAGTYILSADVESTDTDNMYRRIFLYFADGTSKVVDLLSGVRSVADNYVVANSEIVKMLFRASNTDVNSDGDTFSYKNIQIEPGEVATDYEPYTSKTITVTSPDKVNLNDFVMNNPNTVITNDQNVPMTVTYVADPEIYIDNVATPLVNAIVSLGGEV